MVSKFYRVAGHLFRVEAGEALFAQMQNYAPFEVAATTADSPNDECSLIFILSMASGLSIPEYAEDTRQEEEGDVIVCGHTAAGESVFDFSLFGKRAGVLVCAPGYRDATLYLCACGDSPTMQHLSRFALNNSLMVLYALATASLGTALFHSAVVTYGGRGYMFLGKSGTGKSTHARLWLKHNEGSVLLNDDNPVVRILETPDGARNVRVYGSPWSGKTPCYKNEEAELGGIVLLEQAPFNKIRRLRGVEAYAALVSSISGKRWDRSIADGLHATENGLAMNAPVWFFQCLPDEDAAKVCLEAVAR